MRLDDEQESQNIEDRRGFRVSKGVAGGGIGGIAIILIALFLGVDPSAILQNNSQVNVEPEPSAESQRVGRDEGREFVARVLGSTERTWGEIFQRAGRTYTQPKLVLFTGQVQSACGFAQAAAGPFYCGNDQKVYLDLSFFRELHERFQAPGDFAQAYVIAHEVGHHVQTLLGIESQVRRAQQQRPELENELSVRLELQADCYAGVWGHIASQPGRFQRERKPELEPGDAEEGLRAAASIGDDRMQKMGGGVVTPERFTHGSSAQRVTWLKRGLESGSVDACDTFGTK
jgi:predicted metalloprotease